MELLLEMIQLENGEQILVIIIGEQIMMIIRKSLLKDLQNHMIAQAVLEEEEEAEAEVIIMREILEAKEEEVL